MDAKIITKSDGFASNQHSHCSISLNLVTQTELHSVNEDYCFRCLRYWPDSLFYFRPFQETDEVVLILC